MSKILRCLASLSPPHPSPPSQVASPLLITSPANDKVKLIKSLQFRKKRDEQNLILLEGFRLISDSITAGHTADLIMCTKEAAESEGGRTLVHQLNSQSLLGKLHLISDSVFRTLTDTVHGQGVIAIFHKPIHTYKALYTHTSHPSPPPSPPLVILLDGLSDPGNMGSIVRSAYGLGAQCILCMHTCDVFSPKSVRSSMSACMTLPIYSVSSYAELDNLLEEIKIEYNTCHNIHQPIHTYQVLLADASSHTYTPYATLDYTLPTILVIGNEANGISTECKHKFQHGTYTRIPMYRPLESFNAAVATSIILAEAAKQRYGKR